MTFQFSIISPDGEIVLAQSLEASSIEEASEKAEAEAKQYHRDCRAHGHPIEGWSWEIQGDAAAASGAIPT